MFSQTSIPVTCLAHVRLHFGWFFFIENDSYVISAIFVLIYHWYPITLIVLWLQGTPKWADGGRKLPEANIFLSLFFLDGRNGCRVITTLIACWIGFLWGNNNSKANRNQSWKIMFTQMKKYCNFPYVFVLKSPGTMKESPLRLYNWYTYSRLTYVYE